MEQRTLGTAGPAVSLLGLGCNNFGGRIDFEATRAVVHRALDLGVTLFDTADTYGVRGGSEEALGRILGERRKDIVLATKFGMAGGGALGGASRAYVIEAAEGSLRRLKTDWIDLYQLHRPDPRTPIEETLRALDDLVRQGKVRHIGCSYFTAAAARRVARRGARARAPALRHLPERIQPGGARHRARPGAGDGGARRRVPALSAARRRAPHRQVPARRAAAAGRTAQQRRLARRPRT